MSDQFRPSENVEVDLRAVFGAVGRRIPILVIVALIVGAVVFILIGLVEPSYRAETTVLIETGESDITRPIDQIATITLLDREGIASQVVLIRTRDVARAVIDQLNLTEIDEFNPSQAEPSLLDRVRGWIGLTGDRSALPIEEIVLVEFRERLSVSSIEQTRVISIAFVSTDPQLAADIANAVAQQYIDLQRVVRPDTTANATVWLQTEIEVLSERVVAAEADVEAFRAEADLFLAGQNAVTLVAQQLSDISSELSRVQAARAAAEAAAALIRGLLEANTPLSSLDVLNSTLIQRLREGEVLLRSEIAEVSATLLPNHPRLRELNAQLADLESAIRAEAVNILTGFENEAALARGNEAELNEQLDGLKIAVASSSQAEVQLRALERVANAERQLLETYLGLAREAISRQNADYLPVNARIISPAAAPIEAYSPKTVAMTAIAVIIMLMLGAAFLLVRELASGRATRPVAASVPLVPDAVPVDGHGRWADDDDVHRMMPSDPEDRSALAASIEASLTAIAVKLRQMKPRRILITMTIGADADGRPLAAVALARTLASTGARVLLIDLHSDDADRVAMGEAERLPGFGDLFAGEASFAQVIFRDRSSTAHFVPTGKPVDLSLGDRFGQLTEALEQTYDHVVYDTSDSAFPLLGPSAGAAVLVTEFEPSDPRTVEAYDAIQGTSDAEILLLVTDPLEALPERGAVA